MPATLSLERTDRPAVTGRIRRGLAGAVAFVVAIGVGVVLAPSSSAALTSIGPVDPATNFPAYYTDGNGLSLQLCLGLPNCLADTDFVQIHEAGGDAEAFYYAADASTTNFTVHLALEAAYAADGPDEEVVFQRTQLTARGGGLVAGTVYKITDPYGTYNCTVEADGTISQNACRIETTPVAQDFNRSLNGRLGPFLTVDPTEPTPPTGFIGDNATPRKVTGSPTGFNAFRVEGPGLTGTCTNPDGSPVDQCEQTDRFILQGKVADTLTPAASVSQGTVDFGDVPTTPAVTRTLTYSNISTQPVTIGSIAVGGTNAAAFSQTNTCPTTPATLAAGTRCSIDVRFTPESGKSSAATLTITDDTPAGTRNVALKGSNLPRIVVAAPPPPGGLRFVDQQVNSSSPEDNVVIGNTGNGPLTVASATLTGASAAHYRLGPNNTCTTAVPADGGCEIGVVFAPTSTGSKTANLRVTDANGAIVNVPLTGTATPSSLPGAPTGVTATAGNASATVDWTAPSNIGGSAITGYSVRVFSGTTQVGAVRPAAASAGSLNVTGLTNGTAYTFDVAATNATGPGAWSAGSAAVTPQPVVAGEPTGVNATPGNAVATVRWTAPANNGGSAVTGYTVRTFDPAGAQVGPSLTVGNVLNATVAGLANGTAYRFDVAAINGAGTSAFSASSAAVTPVAPPVNTVPGAPTIGAPAAGNASATVRWTAPASNGGTAITGYSVRAYVGTATTVFSTTTAGAAATSVVVPGLANGTAYTFDVRAINAVGTGNSSARSTAVTPVAPVVNAAPTVTARAPAVGGTAVGVGSNITATFSEPVQGVNGTNFQVKNPAGNVVAAAVTQNGTTNQWILNPTANLAPDTRYTVTLTGGAAGIRDSANLGLASAPVTWSFLTGPRPTVTARTPAVGATGVSRTANVTATFSEAVSGVSGTTVRLTNPAGATIPAVVSYNATTRVMTLNPSATLAANTRYTVALTGGATAIRDAAGNPFVTTNWSVTTGP
jgi:methionine-rich copper-binding protein CopC